MILSLRRARVSLFVLLALYLCLWSAPPLRAQDPELTIVAVDTSSYPTITVQLEYANLSSSDVAHIRVLEDGVVRALPVPVPLPTKRIGVLLDSYNGLSVDILLKIADAVDQVEYDSLKWQNQELALFVPGPDGRTLVNQVDWPAPTWREITNGIIAYHNGTGQNRPTAAGTALRELVFAALQQFDAQEGVENYLIVLTDGYDSGSVVSTENLAELIADRAVQVTYVNYDPDGATGNRGQMLSALAQASASQPVDLVDSSGLVPVWRAIAATTLTSQAEYVTQKLPPFTLTAVLSGTAIASAGHQVTAEISPVEVRILRPTPTQIIRADQSEVTLQLVWPPPLSPRPLRRITYTIAGETPRPISLSQLDADNVATFTVRDLVNGPNQLDVVVEEALPGMVARGQAILYVNMPPPPTSTPTATAEPLTPPLYLAAAPAQVDQLLENLQKNAPPQVVPYVPARVTLQDIVLWGMLILSGLVLLAMVLALIAMRRAATWHIAPAPLPNDPTRPGPMTTHTWSPSTEERKAELILIQGEGMLPGLVSLHQGKTYFGRDFGQVDELLANRYVSQKQFSIWEQNGQFYLGNCSISNPTIVNDHEAPRDVTTFPLEGPFLKSGDVIQFGPFKYRFLLSRGTEPGPMTDGANVSMPRRPNPLLHRRRADE